MLCDQPMWKLSLYFFSGFASEAGPVNRWQRPFYSSIFWGVVGTTKRISTYLSTAPSSMLHFFSVQLYTATLFSTADPHYSKLDHSSSRSSTGPTGWTQNWDGKPSPKWRCVYVNGGVCRELAWQHACIARWISINPVQSPPRGEVLFTRFLRLRQITSGFWGYPQTEELSNLLESCVF